ncbi:MAG: transaldolase [Opitutaceae bacterium]
MAPFRLPPGLEGEPDEMGIDPLSPGRPAVFLDRDGTLNLQVIREGKPYAPGRPEDFRLLPGAAAACQALKSAGYALVVVTNQPDVGRGTLARPAVEAMHEQLHAWIPEIDRIEVCYDPGRGEASRRRKPEPGMVLDAAQTMGLDLRRSWLVGDRWRDIDCGRRAGVRTILIDFGYDETPGQPPDHVVKSLGEAAAAILAADGAGRPEAPPHASGTGGGSAESAKPEGYPFPSPPPSPTFSPMNLADLKIQLYADGADRAGILALNAKPHIKGLTTNPSLMRKAGIHDYEAFARDILQAVTAKPISLEVFTDDFAEMRRQALKISAWARNVYTKIPITNARGESSLPVVKELAAQGVKLNITAIFTEAQVRGTVEALNAKVPSVVSVFAGRIADTGVDPAPYMKKYREIVAANPAAELLWASTREVLNLFQAEACGCAIITVPHDILGKAEKLLGIGLEEMSLDTVRTFSKDAKDAGYTL